MKKTVCCFVFLFIMSGLTANLTIGQTKSNSKPKVDVTKTDSLVAESVKAWPKYWGSFRKAVLGNNKTALRDLMFTNIGCPWGFSGGQEPRDGCLEHFEKGGGGKGVWSLGYSLRRIVQPGGRVTFQGASEKVYEARSSHDQTLVARKSLWTQDKSDCTAQFDFEFRSNRWQWTYFASGCD